MPPCEYQSPYDIGPVMISNTQPTLVLSYSSSAAQCSPIVSASEDGGPDDEGTDGDTEVGIATKTQAKPKKPSQYKVLLLNDDYTPMEFVVMILKRFFRMDLEQATRVMLHVHQKGVGVCGIFPYEVAETKVNQVMDFAKENQHPLQCTLEKA
ncbi:ATP-dependent Clp protease adapter ClpS [Pontixanthobacter gangjinensis]